MNEIPVRERVLAAIVARLGTITAVPGLVVERDRPVDQEIERHELPRLLVYDGDEEPDDAFTGEAGWALGVMVEGYAADAATRAILRAEVVLALEADITLGGLARDLAPAADDNPPPPMATVGPVHHFARAWIARYATAEGDPYRLASEGVA